MLQREKTRCYATYVIMLILGFHPFIFLIIK